MIRSFSYKIYLIRIEQVLIKIGDEPPTVHRNSLQLQIWATAWTIEP